MVGSGTPVLLMQTPVLLMQTLVPLMQTLGSTDAEVWFY